MNAGMVFGGDVAVASVFTGVHSSGWRVNSRTSLTGDN